jgi:tRNA pseudouridine13 synthase
MHSFKLKGPLTAEEQFWRIKSQVDDFRVVEVLFPFKHCAPFESHTAITLKKTNLTTFQAVELLARHTSTSIQDWQYAGLKDEDGLTTQTLIFNGTMSVEQVLATQSKSQESLQDKQSIFLEYAGTCDQSLEPGSLLGNAFSILLNDVSPEEHAWIRRNEKRTLSFVNYYDSQRFGFPGHPKHSHTIGRLLNEGQFQDAYELYYVGCPSAQQEQLIDGQSHADFFHHLAPHRKAFYLSSWQSSAWNAALGQLLSDTGHPHIVEVELEGLNFRFTEHATIPLLGERHPLLPYVGFRAKGKEIVRVNKNRTTICSTNYSVVEQDLNSIRVAFFLPAGSYATMFLKQLYVFCRLDLADSI